MQTKLHRWRMNLVTGACSEEQLSDTISEFGMIKRPPAGRQHRYSYAATGVPGRFLFDGLTKHDTATGSRNTAFGEGVFGSETAMAPRLGASADVEDDGYPITLTTDLNNDTSECPRVRRGRADGRTCRPIKLPERISGTHSTWARAVTCRTGRQPASTTNAESITPWT